MSFYRNITRVYHEEVAILSIIEHLSSQATSFWQALTWCAGGWVVIWHDLFHLLLGEEDMLLDKGVILPELELISDPSRVLRLYIEVASTCSRNQSYQH